MIISLFFSSKSSKTVENSFEWLVSWTELLNSGKFDFDNWDVTISKFDFDGGVTFTVVDFDNWGVSFGMFGAIAGDWAASSIEPNKSDIVFGKFDVDGGVIFDVVELDNWDVAFGMFGTIDGDWENMFGGTLATNSGGITEFGAIFFLQLCWYFFFFQV